MRSGRRSTHKQAIALDPNYALAYAGLAEAYSVLPITSDEPSSAVAGSPARQLSTRFALTDCWRKPTRRSDGRSSG